MCGVKQSQNYSVPVPIIAPLFVQDYSVFSKLHLDLAVSDVQSEQGNGSCPWNVEDQPFGRCGLDVEGGVRPGTQVEHNSGDKIAGKSRK